MAWYNRFSGFSWLLKSWRRGKCSLPWRHWDIHAPPPFQRFDIVPPAIRPQIWGFGGSYLPTMKSSTLNSWICFWGASLGCQACIACWAIGQWSYCSLGRCPNGFIKWWVVGPIRASNLEGSALKLSFPVLPWLIPMTLLWCFYSRNLLHQKHLTHLYKNLHLLQLAILWISPHFILTLCPSKQSHAHRSYGGIYSKSDPVCITVKYHISPTLNLNNVVLGGILCLNSLSSLKNVFFEVVTV